MAARTAASEGVGLGKVGFPIIRFTMPWAYETSAGTLFGRASVMVGRRMDLFVSVMVILRFQLGWVGQPSFGLWNSACSS